jgi:hypothetical protein
MLCPTESRTACSTPPDESKCLQLGVRTPATRPCSTCCRLVAAPPGPSIRVSATGWSTGSGQSCSGWGSSFAAGPRGSLSGATPSQLLSPQVYSELLASIAPAGYSEQDLVLSQGRWTLNPSRAQQRGVSAGASTAPASHGSADRIEAELRTLYIQPNLLLTVAERKDQASRTKTTPTKLSEAYPGDTETDVADPSLHPFAEWPWEQRFRVTPDLPYRRVGRILKNGLR